MATLFSILPQLPEGFEYIPDFISEKEEKELIEAIQKITLHPMLFQGYEAKRKVANFGYDWSFEKRILTKGKAIPKEFDWLLKKVSQHISIAEKNFGELLVTEYPVASVINWHRDAPPFDLIAGISLLSGCTFRLRPQEKTKQGRGFVISLPIERKSLYIMKGASRSEWQHSIAPVKSLRYSITLRTLK